MSKIVVGITGLIASGKSTLCKEIKDHYPKVHIFDCDAYVSNMYEDTLFIQRLKVEFGVTTKEEMLECILDEHCDLDFSHLSDFFLIYGLSNAIDVFIKTHSGIILIDAPILFESNIVEDFCNYTVVITGDKDSRASNYNSRENALAVKLGVPIEIFDNGRLSQSEMVMISDYNVVNNYDGVVDISFMKEIMNGFFSGSKTAIYAGSFDPLTNGHIDIIDRGSLLFDNLIIAIGTNKSKESLFSLAERKNMIGEQVKHMPNVYVTEMDNSLIKTMEFHGVKYILRGIRDIDDYKHEAYLNGINTSLCDKFETIYLFADLYTKNISSSQLKKIGNEINWDIELLLHYAPKEILELLKEKMLC